jgi:hypothetical protein
MVGHAARRRRRRPSHLHGFFSSRLEGPLLHADAAALGMCVLAVDRGGAGVSQLHAEQVRAARDEAAAPLAG